MNQLEIASNSRKQALLNPKQEVAALALASGRSGVEAAVEAGVHERTVATWVATIAAFEARIRELRAAMTNQAVGILVANMVAAAETLGSLVRESESEKVRLAAARSLLELGVKLRESIELEQRISELESRNTLARRTA